MRNAVVMSSTHGPTGRRRTMAMSGSRRTWSWHTFRWNVGNFRWKLCQLTLITMRQKSHSGGRRKCKTAGLQRSRRCWGQPERALGWLEAIVAKWVKGDYRILTEMQTNYRGLFTTGAGDYLDGLVYGLLGMRIRRNELRFCPGVVSDRFEGDSVQAHQPLRRGVGSGIQPERGWADRLSVLAAKLTVRTGLLAYFRGNWCCKCLSQNHNQKIVLHVSHAVVYWCGG